MWKLPLPDYSTALDELETALTYKNGKPKYSLMPAEHLAIKMIYRDYEALRGVSNVALKSNVLIGNTLDALVVAYNEVQKNGRLSALRGRLLLATNRCPCCGLKIPDELDHHLPKSEFQALSIYSSNLVPICHNCNNHKKTVTGDNPDERFIHNYYDSVPADHRFLIANVAIVGGGLTVTLTIQKIPQLTINLYKRLAFQMERVKLNERLAMQIIDDLSTMAYSFQSVFESGGAIAVKKLLEGTAKDFRARFGLNHWKTAVMLGLAAHTDFCDGGFRGPLSLPIS
ncbi:HNH endonuclease [Mucilaginibacter phyllosphaerae]